MSDTIRCFWAVKVTPETALRRVLKVLAGMGRALKVEEIENLHITLKFLASAATSTIPEITAVAAKAAERQIPAELTLTGLGVFPHAQRPSVIWAGLAGPGVQTLTALASEFETSLEPLGFPREDRPFTPHLTLARVKARPPEELSQLLSRDATSIFGIAPVNEIELIRSEPGPEGSRYTVLERVPLAGPASGCA